MRTAISCLIPLLFHLFCVPCAAQPAGGGPAAPLRDLPIPGETFLVEGRTAFLIPAKPGTAGKSKRWVWYAPTLPGLPGKEEVWMFDQFRDAGIAIAGIDVGESFGSPAGRKLFSALYADLTGKRGYGAKPMLLGRSRGGLMALSWAAEHPDQVAGFAGIYPVCNIASYPGVAQAAGAYGLKADELQTHLAKHNPIDRLAGLAKAGVPLFAIHGDVDAVVPLEANSGLVKERYEKLGGAMLLVVPKGQGHNMWPGFFRSEDLVRFVLRHAGPALTLEAPLERQIVQRATKEKGTLAIAGTFAEPPTKAATIEARIVAQGTAGAWRPIATLAPSAAKFRAHFEAPAGGWHRLEVRAVVDGSPIADGAVDHVGVGEVFVVAGQSNSANHGEVRQRSKSGLAAAFDGKQWRIADDPQPGASGSGGSFIPPFADALVERLHVPVGIVAVGVGATSVREWLPKGETFPNPPTLVGNVTQRADGEWEAKGDLFAGFVARAQSLGPKGFRAVLWHQGESDANQRDPKRTLPGKLYRDALEKVIRSSRRELGWDVPWFVAQASYQGPGDEGSPDIRSAQASLWKDGIALEGPDTDALAGDFRDGGGRGVHFSGKGLREHGVRWAEKVGPWLDRHD